MPTGICPCRVCVCVHMCLCVCVCVYECVCACVCECMCMCECVSVRDHSLTWSRITLDHSTCNNIIIMYTKMAKANTR